MTIEILPYGKALTKYPEYFKRCEQSVEMPFNYATTSEDIQRCHEATGNEPLAVVTKWSTYVIHPKVTRTEKGLVYGVQHELQTKAHREGRGAQVIIPIFRDEHGVKRTCLVKHPRLTLQHLPPEQGGGYELEIPSCAQRDMSPQDSVLEELKAEANFEAIGRPFRLDSGSTLGSPQLPGSTSELTQVWCVRARPLAGENIEELEGIKGRVFFTERELDVAILRGLYHDTNENKVYLTTLFHNVVAAYYLKETGVWQSA